jgi:hypothetical protein
MYETISEQFTDPDPVRTFVYDCETNYDNRF